jgi:hypothetical protein
VDQILAMECPWGVPTIPKVLCESVERIGRSGVGFGGVYPRAAVHPELSRLDQSNWHLWPVLPVQGPFRIFLGWTVWFVCLWAEMLLVSSWQVSRNLARPCVGFSSSAIWVLEVVFVPGPREVTEASWNFVVYLLFVTGLTGQLQQCDTLKFHH